MKRKIIIASILLILVGCSKEVTYLKSYQPKIPIQTFKKAETKKFNYWEEIDDNNVIYSVMYKKQFKDLILTCTRNKNNYNNLLELCEKYNNGI